MSYGNEMFRRRVEALIGKHGSVTRWAGALGYKRPHVSQVFNGHEPVPVTWMALLEFMESVPRESWPGRWRG